MPTQPEPSARPGGTPAGALARVGFAEPRRARDLLAAAPWLNDVPGASADSAAAELVGMLGAVADPDLALRTLDRVFSAEADVAPALSDLLESDASASRRWLSVAGFSEALGDFVARHPEQLAAITGDSVVQRGDRAALRASLLRSVGADPAAAAPVAAITGQDADNAVRIAYRCHLAVIAADDLAEAADLSGVASELSDLADAVLEAALAIARAEHPEEAAKCRLAVIAMGKCGARELNYISDVDVIFVAEPRDEDGDPAEAVAAATVLAKRLMKVAGGQTSEGSIWEVDPNLRPEGKAGALVRTLASHLTYYERWARTWEFQALLKARPAAGDVELGLAYAESIAPLVWSAADRDNFVEDVQSMRRRVEESIPAREASRALKLGRGGLRDVEFAVQLLQLVHGRSDVMVRSPNTLEALQQLATWGYVGREDAATLSAAYRFERTLEHRLQLRRLRRTHVVPDDPDELRVIGRSMGFRSGPQAALEAEIARHARQVRRLHEKLFYRPLLNAVARLEPGEARLTPDAARARLTALGYADPAGALRHLEALTSGVSRRAAIQRTLLPVMLGWFAATPDPDSGLLGFRRVSDALGATPWYLRLLRDESLAAERLATLLGTSRYLTDLLFGAPEAVSLLADDAELVPRSAPGLASEMSAAIGRHTVAEDAVAAIRGIRRRELFRVGASDLFGLLDVSEVGTALSTISDAAISAAAEVAARGSEIDFGIIAMGRLGGGEQGYGSDADVVFVYRDEAGSPGAQKAAEQVASSLRRLLSLPSTDPPVQLDTDLRPEGRQGAPVRSLDSYRTYFQRWMSTWEAQALLRARPIHGSPALREEVLAVIDQVRYPEGGLSLEQLREIRRLKARMESERLPRGADPALHLKLGRGGLSDVEWVAQLLQLENAAEVPALQVTGTLAAMAAAQDADLLDSDDRQVLSEAWILASRIRNGSTLVTGKPTEQVPVDLATSRGTAFILGYPPDEVSTMREDYLRATRRARAVTDRLFYGETEADLEFS